MSVAGLRAVSDDVTVVAPVRPWPVIRNGCTAREPTTMGSARSGERGKALRRSQDLFARWDALTEQTAGRFAQLRAEREARQRDRPGANWDWCDNLIEQMYANHAEFVAALEQLLPPRPPPRRPKKKK
jgi:hypothetical protein